MTFKADVKRLQVKLNKLKRDSKSKSNVSVIVGYTANYALPVHENLTAQHKKGTQAKYLEQPFREMSNGGDFTRIIARVTKRTGDLGKGLLTAGLALQRNSQQIVPVDTGFLRASAFTREEGSSNSIPIIPENARLNKAGRFIDKDTGRFL